VLQKDTTYQKESFYSNESDTKLLQSTYFPWEAGIISSYSNRICYRKIAESHTRMFRSCMWLLGQLFNKNTMPTSYVITALAIIKSKKHQRLTVPLLLSGVVTHNNHV